MDAMKKSRVLDINLEYYGYSTLQLMEAAGRGIAERLKAKRKDIGIFCGKGNNGGDGLVAARYLLDDNKVTVYLVGGTPQTLVAKQNLELLMRIADICDNLDIVKISDSSQVPDLRKKISSHDMIMDAMLGVGVNGTPREPYASMITLLNSIRSKMLIKVAVDIPSGYGTELSFRCPTVISMHTPKVDLKDVKTLVVDIGIPHEFDKVTGPGNVLALLAREDGSRKGENGKVLVIAGSESYHGAAIYSGIAASRFVDLVYFLTPAATVDIIKKASPEFIVTGLEDTAITKDYLVQFDSVLIGPGLEISDANARIVKDILSHKVKTVIDASALSLLDVKDLHGDCIITPHKGEFNRLFGMYDDAKAVLSLSKRYGCCMVLKGKVDMISDGKEVYRNFSGNSGMTAGGTGDILAGLITAFFAKNNALESAMAGAFLSGHAGDLLKGKPFSASDVVDMIPMAYDDIRRFI